MILTNFLFQRSDHHLFKSGVVSRFTLFEQYLECRATAMALAVLTFEAADKMKYPEFPRVAASSSQLWLHPIVCGTTVCGQSTFQILLRSKKGLVCVADLEILDPVSNGFHVVQLSLERRLYFMKSPSMIFLRPLAILESETSKFLCNPSPCVLCDVFR